MPDWLWNTFAVVGMLATTGTLGLMGWALYDSWQRGWL